MRGVVSRLAQVVRGVLVKAHANPEGLSKVKVKRLPDGTVLDDIFRLENFGLAGRPPDGAQVLLVRLDGQQHVVLAAEHASYRFADLGEGEAALYDAHGNSVYLKDGEIRVTAPTKVVVDAPQIHLGGDVLAPTPANAVLYGPTGQSGVPSTKVFVAG
ncbi:phage baseplate assembly protein [bacterium]|nr:phage baseplate assembly protein [bacterium]